MSLRDRGEPEASLITTNDAALRASQGLEQQLPRKRLHRLVAVHPSPQPGWGRERSRDPSAGVTLIQRCSFRRRWNLVGA